jgi:hypothetical protein
MEGMRSLRIFQVTSTDTQETGGRSEDGEGKTALSRENRFHWPSDWRNVSIFVAWKFYFITILSVQIKFLKLHLCQPYFPESLCHWTTMGAGVWSQVGFLVDINSSTMTDFSPFTSVFPRRYYSTNAAYPYFIHLPSLLYDHSNWQSSRKHSSISVSFCQIICSRPPSTLWIRTFLKSYSRSAQIPGARSTGRIHLARWHLIIFGPQHGNCYMVTFWRLEFWGGSWFLENLCNPVIRSNLFMAVRIMALATTCNSLGCLEVGRLVGVFDDFVGGKNRMGQTKQVVVSGRLHVEKGDSWRGCSWLSITYNSGVVIAVLYIWSTWNGENLLTACRLLWQAAIKWLSSLLCIKKIPSSMHELETNSVSMGKYIQMKRFWQNAWKTKTQKVVLRRMLRR